MKKPLISITHSVNEWKIKNYQDAIFLSHQMIDCNNVTTIEKLFAAITGIQKCYKKFQGNERT